MKLQPPTCPNCDAPTKFRSTRKARTGDTVRRYICAMCGWLRLIIVPKKPKP